MVKPTREEQIESIMACGISPTEARQAVDMADKYGYELGPDLPIKVQRERAQQWLSYQMRPKMIGMSQEEVQVLAEAYLDSAKEQGIGEDPGPDYTDARDLWATIMGMVAYLIAANNRRIEADLKRRGLLD
jgi:hypothetical protein